MYYRILLVLIIVTVNSCCGMDPAEKEVKKKILISNKSHIIFLNGTTTAGKSSIALELKARLEKQSLPVDILALDAFVVPKIQWALGANRFNPRNILVANVDLITPLEIEEIVKKSQVELCSAARVAYDQGKLVIIDAPAYSSEKIDFYQQELKGLNVTWSLVYCPVSTLVERVINRNKTSGIMEQRSILQALNQFNHLYCRSDHYCQSDYSIDKLSQENVHAVCDRAQAQHIIMQDKIPDFLKSVQRAICPFNIDDIRESMLEKFTLNSSLQINIGPIIQYNCIVNSGLDNSVSCTKAIIKAVGIQQTGDNIIIF